MASSYQPNTLNATYRAPENQPECCRETNLPIYKKIRDPTITTAPLRTYQDSKKFCDCKSNEYVERKFIQPSADLVRPNLTYLNQNVPQGYRQNVPQMYVQSPVNTTRNVARSGSLPRNQTFSIPRDVTRSFQSSQRGDTFRRPLGFDHLSEQHPINTTYNQPSPVFLSTQASSGTDEYWSENYSDHGPWRNVVLPKKIKKKNLAPLASETYPRLGVPVPSRNYSTYRDPQPIVNIREVAEHRKKAPRFYSTPSTSIFDNKGTSLSSVWGQDAGRTDSSSGWSKGVRMDSFNVYRDVTPSPRTVRGEPRAYASQKYAPRPANRIPTPYRTHTYLPDPFPPINNPYNILSTGTSKISQSRNRQPLPRINKTHEVPPPKNETYRAPDLSNKTYTVDKSDEKPGDVTEVEKRRQEGKDFCTVLEIRTPCAENPCVPEKPLQLSINVTCVDPSMLITPDKRFNVIKQRPELPPATAPQNKVEEVPSDCDCA